MHWQHQHRKQLVNDVSRHRFLRTDVSFQKVLLSKKKIKIKKYNLTILCNCDLQVFLVLIHSDSLVFLLQFSFLQKDQNVKVGKESNIWVLLGARWRSYWKLWCPSTLKMYFGILAEKTLLKFKIFKKYSFLL